MISIEIGNHNLKIVNKEIRDMTMRLIDKKVMALVNDSLIVQDTVLVEQLQTVNKAEGIFTSISGPGVIIRPVKLPKTTFAEAEKLIDSEDKYLPLNVDKEQFVYKLMGNDSDQEDNEDYIFVGIRKNRLTWLHSVCARAGLTIDSIEVDSVALFNAYKFFIKDTKQCCALINVGAKHSFIVFVNKGLFVSCRELERGGSDITAGIANAQKIDLVSAEKAKIEKPEEYNHFYEAFTDGVAEDIKTTFSFYEEKYKCQVKQIYLSGGVSASGLFRDYLQDYMDMPVTLFGSERGGDAKELPDLQQWAVTAGIGMGDVL